MDARGWNVVAVIEILHLRLERLPLVGLFAGPVFLGLAMLGPGRWSVDARLFGWKRIGAPPRRNTSDAASAESLLLPEPAFASRLCGDGPLVSSCRGAQGPHQDHNRIRPDRARTPERVARTPPYRVVSRPGEVVGTPFQVVRSHPRSGLNNSTKSSGQPFMSV